MKKISYNTSIDEFISSINSNFAELATNWNCNVESFYMLKKGMTIEQVKWILNHNFRCNDFTNTMTTVEFVDKINELFGSYIWRFNHLIENIVPSGEASAVITENGNKVNIVSNDFYIYSTDGVHYSTPQLISHDGAIGWVNNCPRMVMIDGVIYKTAASKDFTSLILYSSEDFINWTTVRTIMDGNRNDSWKKNLYGNSFLFKNPDDGKFYLIYEARHTNIKTQQKRSVWRIGIAYTSDLSQPFVDFEDNPVVPYDNWFSVDEGTGRPELAMINNNVIKVNGKFYLYYIYNNTNEGNAINRAWSYDLHHWVVEGSVLDNRIKCIPPATSYGNNGLFEFKGKTYMMYTANADPVTANTHTDITIDDRDMITILSLKP